MLRPPTAHLLLIFLREILLLAVALVMPVPSLIPAVEILDSTIRSSCPHPKHQDSEPSPECYPLRHAEPEEEGVLQHAEQLHGDVEDYKQECDAGDVGLVCDLEAEAVEVFLRCVGVAQGLVDVGDV